MRRSLLLLPLLPLLICMPDVATAQGWPALDSAPSIARMGTNDVAVLVAVEKYLFVPGVKGARQNLVDWDTFLRNGLGVSTISTLLNEQATREEVLAAAEAANALAGPESTVWFLFIGHGAPSADGTDGALLGVDVQQNARSVAARGILRGELLQQLQAGPQKRTVVILDACFSGRTADGAALVPDSQPVVPVGQPRIGERMVVMSAAESDEIAGSLPGLDRPAFSYLVLGGLRGWASGDDGQVTADEAVAFASRELLTVPGRRQTPAVAGLRDTVLTSEARESRPRTDQVIATAEPQPSTAEPPTAIRSDRSAAELKEPRRLYLSMGLGAGAETTYETGTMLIGATLGLRATSTRAPTRINVMAGIDYANVTNVYAREQESEVNAALQGAGLPASVSLEVGERSHLVAFTTGPGLEVGQGSFGFFGELRGGIAIPMGGECRAWQADENGDNQRCSNRETDVAPAFRARLGVSYRLIELAAHAGFTPRDYEVLVDRDGVISKENRSQTLFVAGLTLGVGFDL